MAYEKNMYIYKHTHIIPTESIDKDSGNMSVIRISYRDIHKCLTNINHFTTVGDIIHSFIDDLSDDEEEEDLSREDYCLCLEYHSYLLVLKPTDFIRDILRRYSRTSDIRLKLHSSAQRQKLSSMIDPYEQLRIQEQLIQKQQEIINQLTHPRNHRETTRSLSRVRFRLSTATTKHPLPSSTTEVKSILKNTSRPSSVDRDIDQLVALERQETHLPLSDDDHSTTDSLSSEDSGCYSLSQRLETLV